jgi:hypothetical protein
MTQMVDSHQQELSTDQIVQIASENTRAPYPFKKVYMLFVAEMGMPNTKLYKIGNTLFIIHPSDNDPSYGIFRALNADTARNFVENGKEFVDRAVSDGFKALKTQFSDQSILQIFNIIGREEQELQNPNLGYAVGRAKNGDYSVSLMLGERRGQ